MFSEIHEYPGSAKGILTFAFFELWLLAFPLEGFLLGEAAHLRFLYLLPFLLLGLLLFGRLLPPRYLSSLTPVGIFLTALLTAIFPFFPAAQLVLLGAIGLSSAFLVLQAFSLLKGSPRPLPDAGVGIVLGALLLWALMAVPLAVPLKAAIVALGVLMPLSQPVPQGEDASSAVSYPWLLLIFLFQCLSGLMYGKIAIDYAAHTPYPGAEVLFYILTVSVSTVLVAKGKRDLLFPLGVVMAVASFSLLHGQGELWDNLGMYAMQGASGFVDYFSVAIILAGGDVRRRTQQVVGVACLGILTGRIVVEATDSIPLVHLALAQLILPLSLLVLYYHDRRRHPLVVGVAETADPPPASLLPRQLAGLLAPKEHLVLELVVTGKSFAEVAPLAGISVSSVKTYMCRIYQKAGVSCRREIVALVERLLVEEGQGEAVSAEDPSVGTAEAEESLAPGAAVEMGKAD